MWPYPWTHVGTPSHLGHVDRVAATLPSQAPAGAAYQAPDLGQWEGQGVPLVTPSSCTVKGGIPSSRRYLPTYLQGSGEEPTAKVAVQRIGALERQHFYLGVSSQEVGTNDDVKGVGVQHSAVLGHSFFAKTNSHIDSPQGMDGTPIPYSYGHCLGFLESL